jgi:RsiW-degrading membrane proteinase PrsW (M82 family)
MPNSEITGASSGGRDDEGEILAMTVPPGPDQPPRGYGAPQPGGHPAQPPQGQQPGYGAPQQPQPPQPPQHQPPQYQQQPAQPQAWGQPAQPQYQQPYQQPQQQQGWGQQPPPPPPYGQSGGYPAQQPYFPQLPRQAVHFNPVMLLPIHHWIRDRSLRNWITILFVALVVVPSITLVYVGDDVSKISRSTWAFAIYFACAWLLVLWIAVRPPMVRPMMLLEVGLIGLIFEAPLAIWLEKKLETPNQNLFSYIFTVGLPEEFVKILPIVVLGLILKNVWGPLTPKDYLFLGAVSGLAFGAAEAVQYINVYIPSNSGEIATAAANQGADPNSIGQYIAMTSIQSGSWRFVTDPMSHAVWAGISGYFVGLAFQHRRYFWLALVGLGLTSLLHGINDDVAGHWFWIVEIVVSVLLFMAYVQAGGVIEQQLTEADEAHARQAGQYGHPAGAYAMPMQQPMGAPGWGQNPPPPAPGTTGGWAPTGSTGSYPAAPTWNPAAGWGHSGFTQLPGYRPPNSGQQPPPA